VSAEDASRAATEVQTSATTTTRVTKGTESGLRLEALLAKGEAAFAQYSRDSCLTWSRLFTVFDCLAGGNVDLGTFLQLASPIAPRFYSISSVLTTEKKTVTVTVARLAYKAPSDGSPRFGLCSTYCARLRPGTRVEAKLEPVASFRPPVKPTSNVLMIGAGTGVAPFRAFTQELRRRREREKLATGEALLVVGARTRDAVLYRDDMEAAVASGTLAEPILALSREPGQPRTYVQDVVDDEAKRLRDLILPRRNDDGESLDQSIGTRKKRIARELGHVYVCGDSLMADAVKKALARALGKDAFNALVENGKLHEDVFGIQLQTSVAKAKLAESSTREGTVLHRES